MNARSDPDLAALLLGGCAPRSPTPSSPNRRGRGVRRRRRPQLLAEHVQLELGGGDQGRSSGLNSDLTAQRQFSTRFNISPLQLASGQTSRQVPDANGRCPGTSPQDHDLIAFESVGRWTLGAFAEPYFALRIDSQFLVKQSTGRVRFNPIKLKIGGRCPRLMKTGIRKRSRASASAFAMTIAKTIVTRRWKVNSHQRTAGSWQTSVTRLLGKRCSTRAVLVYQPCSTPSPTRSTSSMPGARRLSRPRVRSRTSGRVPTELSDPSPPRLQRFSRST